MELKGKTAIVTGGSGALGGEIAVGLARAGCDVVVHCFRNRHRAEEIAMRVRKAGRAAATVQADLTSRDGVRRLFEGAGALEPARILVNSAAVFGRTPVGGIRHAAASKMLRMNLLAPVLTAQKFAEVLRECRTDAEQKKPCGKIVNIADVGGERPWKEYSIYCAAKAGLIAATKALAKELAPGITVNAVAPGLVTWPDDIDEAGRKRQIGFIPAGRIARHDEIAAAVIFLLRNDYITGQVLNVDGGRVL
ncbi:MAG TPA: SDR family oxidoreductase [Sedimentisphaerales bacterium]|nr:SDR family oxidoreductase [Sedimentisphaerales bacterium]